MKRVPLELVRSVRQIFESRFHAMPQPSPKGFAFRDVIQLEKSELHQLMRALGLVELGQAFVSVGKMALAELCRRLPREKAEELILAVRGASQVDSAGAQERAALLVARGRELLRHRGVLPEGGPVAARQGLAARGPDLSRALFVSGCRARPGSFRELTSGRRRRWATSARRCSRRLQDSILLSLRELARRGEVDARWAEVEMTFHDPAARKPAPRPFAARRRPA